MKLLNRLDLIAPLVLVVAVAGILLYAQPTRENLTHRKNLLAGVALGKEVVQRVKVFHGSEGRWPNGLEELTLPERPRSDYVESLTLGDQGRVEVKLKGDEAFAGKSLVFDFVERGGYLVWRCRGEGLPDDWLPDMCRSDRG
ncbi:pilin [Endothiovibrio diazotrophicus]